MEAKLLLSYLEETHLLCYPPNLSTRRLWSLPVNNTDSRSPVPVSASDGGENLSPLSCGCLPLSPACLFSNPPDRRWSEAQEALSAACPKAHARHRHPIKALGTPCSKLSQLGCVWAQIFEQRSTVRVPLAEHHRIPRPKQKLGGGEIGGEGVWMLGMCITHVYTQVSSLPSPSSKTYHLIKFTVEEEFGLYVLMYSFYWSYVIVFDWQVNLDNKESWVSFHENFHHIKSVLPYKGKIQYLNLTF